MSRVLCIWLADWPIQRWRCRRPELIGRPLALSGPHRRGGLQVVACSVEARQQGVQIAMPLAESLALVPSLRVESADPIAQRQELVELARWCQRYSPLVGLEPGPAPESLLAEIHGLARLFGGELALAQRAQQELGRRRLAARIAVADTIGAAWALSHYREACRQQPVLIPPGETQTALAPLPVECLQLPPSTAQRLRQLGIETVGQLALLPRDGLAARFGLQLLQQLDRASGAQADVIEAVDPPRDFQASWQLEHPTTRRETVTLVLEELVARVAGQLASAGCGTQELLCRLDAERRSLIALRVGLYRPSADAAHLQQLLHLQLERYRVDDAVAAVAVSAQRVAPLGYRQRTLFADQRPQADLQQLAGLVDRLTGRLGRQAVVRVRLRADAQPELAWRDQPLVETRRPKNSSGSKSTAGQSQWEPLERPLWVWPRPKPIRVEIRDEQPQCFYWGRQSYPIARLWGPERLETGWWRKQAIARDYFRVETAAGSRLWIFRRLRDDRWFWHGEFA